MVTMLARAKKSAQNMLENPKEHRWRFAKILGTLGFLVWTFAKFVLIPAAASRTLDFMQDRYEPEITVESWSASVANLSATAHNLVIAIDGPYDHGELLTIDELEIDLSLARRLFKGTWIKSITARSSRLYLERLLSGATNWDSLINPQTLANLNDSTASSLQTQELKATASGQVVSASDPQFSIPRVRLEGLTIEWVEKIPGHSDGGLIVEQQATLFVDDVEVVVTELSGLFDGRELPSKFLLEGRVADGKVSLQTRANFFAWARRRVSDNTDQDSSRASPLIGWSPSLKGSLYLENIGAATLGRLVPRAVLQPKRGSLTGSIDFELRQHELTCNADVQLSQFEYAANSRSPVLGRRRKETERALSTFQASGHYFFDCGGNMNDDRFRPLQSFQARTTRQAVDSAPRIVRAAATVDEARYGETDVQPELASIVAKLARSDPSSDYFGLPPEFLRTVARIARGRFSNLRRSFPKR